MAEKFAVGFVGVGAMGGPMVRNINKEGYPLAVYDLNHGVAKSLAQDIGAQFLASVAELALQDVIVCMLPNGNVVREILLNADGGAFLKSARPGTVIVDMSSSEPTGTKELAAILAEKQIILIDAPVSGGVARAITGELTIMIGGDDKNVINKIKPLMAAMGNNLFDTGNSGTGHAVKALNNVIAATSFLATSEAMIVAKRFGLDTETLINIVNLSTGHSFMSDHVMKQHVISEQYKTNFALGLLVKDVNIAVGLCEAMNSDAPLYKLVRDRWTMALDELGYSADNSEAIKVWETLSK